ncbi:unnamed protein product [Rotaria sp. Silwood2]|nr:unnamed protein product [Rotaria sp. Silwood2]CAF2758555.1 unnamed protein product [Rotaria sp. Silwood2]CAF3175339.1 unnamed protein product [Rotaria sp. Silwood2]CAF3215486.1 unnamed protein product [Rotaria sp. Silwood2]CAF4183367.1 unnamed protein product [Rotaria sp. Silwood2]
MSNTRNEGRSSTNRVTKPIDPKTKKHSEDSTTPDDVDINTINKQQCDESLNPMPNVLECQLLFATDIVPDVIQNFW